MVTRGLAARGGRAHTHTHTDTRTELNKWRRRMDAGLQCVAVLLHKSSRVL